MKTAKYLGILWVIGLLPLAGCSSKPEPVNLSESQTSKTTKGKTAAAVTPKDETDDAMTEDDPPVDEAPTADDPILGAPKKADPIVQASPQPAPTPAATPTAAPPATPPPATPPPPASTTATGTTMVTFAPRTYPGAAYPALVYAVWVSNAAGQYVKTVSARAQTRVRFLDKWFAAAGVALPTLPDGIAGASLTYAATANAPINVVWDMKNRAGAFVPHGNYNINIQMTSANNTGLSLVIPITVNAAGITKTDTTMATGITAVTVKHTP